MKKHDYRMSGKIKIVLYVLITIVISFVIAGCNDIKNMQSVDNELKKETVKNDNVSILSEPQNLITYKGNNILLWLEQSIFIDKHGDIIEKTNSMYTGEELKTSVVLKYVIEEKIHEIDLSTLVIDHSLKGVQNVVASPNGKYVALEFNSSDCHETVLIDITSNTAKMLYDNESSKNPMISVSWKYNDDNIFAYIPAFPEEKIIELKMYNIANKSKKTICKLDDNFTGYSSMIDWNKDNIRIIDVYNNNLIKIDNY